MRKLINIISLFFGFSLLMFLFMMLFQQLGIVDLQSQERMIISATTGVLLTISYFVDF